MDEFLEQVLSGSSWGDRMNRASWDADCGNIGAIDSSCVPRSIARVCTSPMGSSSGPLGGILGTQALDSCGRAAHGSVGTCLESKNGHYVYNASDPSSRFEQHELGQDVFLPPTGLPHEATHVPLHRLTEGGTVTGGPMALQLNTSSPVIGKTLQNLPSLGGLTIGPAPLVTSSLIGHGSFEASDFQQIAPTWHQPYIGGVPAPSTTLGQGKHEMFVLNTGDQTLSTDSTHLGKRTRIHEEMQNENQQEEMSIHAAHSIGLQSGQAYEEQVICGSQTVETSAAVNGNGYGRLRVRARRGQATDPHSIAERNRRERIAERMKALQELVPESNKTDKASMLDEIINYVKFLQMQVKCLSLCRLGVHAGAAVPLLKEFEKEGSGFMADEANGIRGCGEGMMGCVERQANLMDEGMNAAMQYLQRKGLCLMPISLATAISSTAGVRQQQQQQAAIGLELMHAASEKQQPSPPSDPHRMQASPDIISNALSTSFSGSNGDDVHMTAFEGIAKVEPSNEKVQSPPAHFHK